MSGRDEAMRAAAETVTIDRQPEREEADIATAGADAELAQLERWLDAVPVDARDNPVLLKLKILRTIQAHAHWKGQADG